MTDLAHAALGHGPPFVWAHGLTSSRAHEEAGGLFDWTPVTAQGHQVIRYDARGHGQTGGPTDPAAYCWPRLAVELLPEAELHVATRIRDVLRWPAQVASFLDAT